MVVHHNYVVHAIDIFLPIKLTMMGWIVRRLMGFDEGPINKSNATLELCGSCHQSSSLLNSGPTNLIKYGKIDARCNTYVIVIYCTLVPIPHQGIIFSHIIMFHKQDETKQMLFQGQLGWLPNNVMWLPCGACMTNNGWDHKLCQFFKFSQSEIGERFKTNLVWLAWLLGCPAHLHWG
jgi:hypothetical protein